MASYNKITLVGNVGNDPQLKAFEQTKVAEFSIAVNESYTDRNGQRVEKTDWFRCGVWGNRADVIMNYLKRGSQIMVEGRLNVRTYVDPTTQKDRFTLDVRVADFVLLGGRENAGGMPPAGAPAGSYSAPQPAARTGAAPAYQTAGEPAAPYAGGAPDDDLPF